MKETEWTLRIPGIIKEQVKHGIGNITISYQPCENKPCCVKKVINIKLIEANPEGIVMCTYDSDKEDLSFYDWFNTVRLSRHLLYDNLHKDGNK